MSPRRINNTRLCACHRTNDPKTTASLRRHRDWHGVKKSKMAYSIHSGHHSVVEEQIFRFSHLIMGFNPSLLAPYASGGGFSHRTSRIIHVIRVVIHGRLLVAMTIQQRTLLHFFAQQVVLGVHFSIETLTAPVKLFHVPPRRLNSHFSTVSLVPSSWQIYNTNTLRAFRHSDVSFIDHAVHLHCQPCLRSRFGFHADWPCTGSGQWSASAMHRYAFISINPVHSGS